jgi:uncharacterized protein
MQRKESSGMSLLRRIFPGLEDWLTRRRKPAEPDVWLRAFNVNRQRFIAERLEVADTSAKRNKGLLGRAGLDAGTGLWISPCESVHTFFMQFPIDLVYLDRKHCIRKVRSNVGAWRMSICLSAHSIIELPAGVILETGSQPGDVIEFSDLVVKADGTEVVADELNSVPAPSAHSEGIEA